MGISLLANEKGILFLAIKATQFSSAFMIGSFSGRNSLVNDGALVLAIDFMADMW